MKHELHRQTFLALAQQLNQTRGNERVIPVPVTRIVKRKIEQPGACWFFTALHRQGPYLQASTLEIQDPNFGHLDAYLRPVIGAPISRDQWAQSVATMPSLDGTNTLRDTAEQYEEPDVTKRHQAFERRRGYKLDKWAQATPASIGSGATRRPCMLHDERCFQAQQTPAA